MLYICDRSSYDLDKDEDDTDELWILIMISTIILFSRVQMPVNQHCLCNDWRQAGNYSN